MHGEHGGVAVRSGSGAGSGALRMVTMGDTEAGSGGISVATGGGAETFPRGKLPSIAPTKKWLYESIRTSRETFFDTFGYFFDSVKTNV